MKAPGFLDFVIYRYSNNNKMKNGFYLKNEWLGSTFVDFELNQWYYLKIERRSTGHPDNKCSTTFHVDFNQIFEKVTDCGSYSATETELYASCASSSCDSVSGLIDSMRFVWL